MVAAVDFMEGTLKCIRGTVIEKHCCFSRKHLASSIVDIRCPTPGKGKNTSTISSISLISSSSSFTGLCSLEFFVLRERETRSSNVEKEEPPCATAFLLASAISLALFLTFCPSSVSPIKHLTPFSNS
ncbi:hypothetical protein CKAN_00232700 [Cinnamomum micranthum f. kanehirae]|uniref:Uncharacterized protein n=1 Tax=Cinnamomum micranthum f. kanehirae TaxID=337451 RepID=A0A443N679_9MAGN|nr:hypothetical protein CKAN_00232700 [Cinnamomum micranthum f. kanehirae]